MKMNKRGDIMAVSRGIIPRPKSNLINILIGIVLVALAINSAFGWISYELFGLNFAVLALVVLTGLFLIFAIRSKKVTTILLTLLFAAITLNAYLGWYTFELIGLDLTSLALLVLGVVWLIFEFMRKPMYR
jgi:hypothetical protein